MNSLMIVILSLCNPVLSFPISIICLSQSLKDWKAHVFSICMFWASMSYCYNPLSATDLTRYFEYTSTLRNMSFIEAVKKVYEGQSFLYAFNAAGWFCETLKDPHLLPAISTFFVYYIVLYITLSICEKESIEPKYALIYILFSFCTIDWYAITNNLRNILAFAIVSLAVYRDMYLRKKTAFTYFLYVLPVSIHPTAILLIVIRIAITAVNKFKYILPVLVLMVNPLVNFLYTVGRKSIHNYYFDYIVSKMYNYFFDTGSAWGLEVSNSLYYRVNRILYISMMIMMVILILMYDKRRKGQKYITGEEKDNLISTSLIRFQKYLLMLCLMSISCMKMLRPEYWRFSAVSIICGSSILIPSIIDNKKILVEKISICWILLLTPMCLVVWLYRLQYIDLQDFIVSILTNSPLLTIIKDFLG